MATPPFPSQPTQPHLTYVDRPEISETYADLLGRLSFDGITARLEFVVNRYDDRQPGQPITGKALTAARVVIPLPAVMDLAAKLQNFMAQLQASGVLRQVHVPGGQGPQRPN